jgi:hypothetical protein
MRFSRVLLIAAISSGLLSCSKVEKSSTLLESTEESSTTTVGDSPFYVIVQSKYQTAADSTLYTEGSCQLKTTDAIGTHLDCGIEIPELRLHYSDIKFKVGLLNAPSCKIVQFWPYVYVKSTDAAASLPGHVAATDCSDGTKAECYGGSAKSIITNANAAFPDTAYLFFATNVATEMTYTATALSEREASEGKDNPSLFYNVDIANNLVDRNTAITPPVAAHPYLIYKGGGQYQDYYFACLDQYHEDVYTITLTISDKDTSTAEGTSDQRYDWN